MKTEKAERRFPTSRAAWPLWVGASLAAAALSAPLSAGPINMGVNFAGGNPSGGEFDNVDWGNFDNKNNFVFGPTSTNVTSGGNTITVTASRENGAETLNRTRTASSPISDFTNPVFINRKDPAMFFEVTGVPEGDDVSLWLYGVRSAGNIGTAYEFDFDNDGSFDTDLFGSGQSVVEHSFGGNVSAQSLSPDLGATKGFFEGTGNDEGVLQVNFTAGADGFRVGWGALGTGAQGASSGFTLEAVPEPETYALIFGSAVLGMALLRRNRTRG